MTQQPDWLVEQDYTLNGKTVTYSYDREADILEIFFQRGGGVGIDLAENIVLRFNRESGEALSLILTNFSQISHPTRFGPPSFRLTALADLPPEMQQRIIDILTSFPVNCFLKTSGLFPTSGEELLPIAHFEQPVNAPLDTVVA